MYSIIVKEYDNRYSVRIRDDRKKLSIFFRNRRIDEYEQSVNYDATDLGVSLLITDLISWLRDEEVLTKKNGTVKEMKESLLRQINACMNQVFNLIDVDNYYIGEEDE